MALVYEAIRADTQQRVALKVIKIPHESARVRLQVEGRAQGAIDHPNVVRVYEVIRVEGSPCLVMEFVEGEDLEQFIAKGRPPIEVADSIAQGILQGVVAAHDKGVLHRDLKPANVVLAKGDPVTPKVMDFGLARLTGLEQESMRVTRTGMTMGTPAFMPPEQIRNAKSVDERADVYSLGVLLYELVSAERAFEDEDIIAVLQRVAKGERRPIRDVVPGLPNRMVQAIEGAFEVDPDLRIPDAETLLAVWRGEHAWALETQPVRAWVFAAVASSLAFAGAVAGIAVVAVLLLLVVPRDEPAPPIVQPPTASPVEVFDPGESVSAPRTTTDPEEPVEPAQVASSSSGRVVVTGGAASVRMTRDRKSYPVGESVPPGIYTVQAVFSDSSVFPMTVRVKPGAVVRVNCDSRFKDCALK